MPTNTEIPQKFEDAMQELQSIVQSMEGQALPLDEALKAYERGVMLSKVCQQKLQAAEQQVKVLQGQLLQPLNEEDDVAF